MPLFEENNPPKSPLDNSSPPTPAETKSESSLVKTIGQCLTFAPLVFEQFTGQKVPAIGGTLAEIQLALTQIQTNLQVVVNNQSQLAQRLVNLENNASQQFTNLTQQFQSFRLTHTREKKEIEYNNPNPNKLEEY